MMGCKKKKKKMRDKKTEGKKEIQKNGKISKITEGGEG